MFPVWLVLVTLGILGPLVGRGHLLLLDLPEGPQPQWPKPFPLPSDGLVAAASVLSGAITRLVALVSPELQNKVLILAIVMVGGMGLARGCTKQLGLSTPAAIVAATLFVVNPFVYDRVLMGQLVLLLAYAMLPFTLRSLIELVNEGSRGGLLRGLTWTGLITLIDLHVGGMALLLLILAILVSPSAAPVKLFRCVAVVLALIGLNFYWILPAFLASESARLGAGDLIAYAPRPRSPRVLAHVLLLHGAWRTEFTSPLASAPVLFLGAFLPLLWSACYGLLVALGFVKWTRLAKVLGISALISVVLATGTSFPPTAWITRLLFEHLPGYGIYREPQKWVALLGFCYAVFAAIGLDKLHSKVAARAPRVLPALALGVLLPLVATSTMWWGFDGQLQTSEFPDDWAKANALTRSKSGRLLFLPWNLYQPLPFAGNRTVASPAERFFDMPALVSGDAALGAEDSTDAFDPRDRYVSQLLSRRGSIHAFGHLIAPLGARYVALAHVADAPEYGFLEHQQDLRPVFEGDDLVLYENLAWESEFYGLKEAEDLDGSAREHQDEVATALVGGEPSRAQLDGPSLLNSAPWWKEVPVTDAPLTGTDLSCTDGWELGGREPVCHVGALAAFQTPTRVSLLARPGITIQLFGYTISLCIIGMATVAGIRALRKEHQRGVRSQ